RDWSSDVCSSDLVRHRERQHLESRDPDGLERPVRAELDVRPCRAVGHALRRIEDIREARAEQLGADGVRPDDDVTLGVYGEGPEVVDPMHVVGVGVRVPHRVDGIDLLAQELEPELRRRVDEEPAGAVVALEEGGVTVPPVPGVRRGARRATAPDDRDSERSAGAEEAEPHSSSTRSMLVVPRTWKGTPAVTTILCPGLAIPREMRNSRAQSSIDS